MTTTPRWLYLHGFASSADSSKGRALGTHYQAQGIALERLNLRVPSFERLRLSVMMQTVRDAIGGERDRAVVMGSSLGGLCAARVAEQDSRVGALVLMAPAFQLVKRWRESMGPSAWAQWKSTGWLEQEDYAEHRKRQVDFEFMVDAEAIDARSGGWPDVRVPTLILHGKRDDVVTIDLSREFSRNKRHVQLIELDDGHDLGQSIDRIITEADRFLEPWIGK